jgi:hypothetical protein
VLKKERGCEAEGIVPFYINDERFFRCPLKLITPVSYEYIAAYRLYEKGYLPHGAGWVAESRKFLDAMAVIENAVTKQEIEQAKKIKRTS